ncbi:hypothetical protein Jiend_13250 [Micromonospora endophytica]|nr:hypothetical protein Jiend_13250 [Micromonospora endophytica]
MAITAGSARICSSLRGKSGLGRPKVIAASQVAMIASPKWVADPADITIVRFHTG